MSKLFYVIGASGSGKDTLINYARNSTNLSGKVIFAHRYITRPAFSGNENHVSLSKNEFESRLNAHLFALHWESHNNHYGIGIEINSWMENGFNVVMNGSREYLPIAREKYPELLVVSIEASPSVIRARLATRGRENNDEIISRIERTEKINVDLSNAIKIQNDGTVEEAGEIFVKIISHGVSDIKAS
jgi:ribose 1,5-bisphosphokinase